MGEQEWEDLKLEILIKFKSNFSARKYLIREKDEDLPMARKKFRHMCVLIESLCYATGNCLSFCLPSVLISPRQILDKVSKTIIVVMFFYWLFQRYHVMDYLNAYFSEATPTTAA